MTYATVPSKLKSSCLLIQQICQSQEKTKSEIGFKPKLWSKALAKLPM